MVTPMSNHDVLPLAARRAAWDRLWRILLSPPRPEPADPDETRIPHSALPKWSAQPDAGSAHDRRDRTTGCRPGRSRSGHSPNRRRP